MTREEKQKAINALRISAPIKALTREEINDYIQTLNKVMDWLEQESTEKPHIKGDYYDGFKNGMRTAKWRYDKIRAEIEQNANRLKDSLYGDGLRHALEIIDKYKAERKSLKEKDEPKAVRYEGDGYADGAIVYDVAFCPNCEHEFEEDSENWECEFCPNCGQRLRWEE